MFDVSSRKAMEATLQGIENEITRRVEAQKAIEERNLDAVRAIAAQRAGILGTSAQFVGPDDVDGPAPAPAPTNTYTDEIGEAMDEVEELMLRLLRTLRKHRPQHRSELARRWAITITEMEKVYAYFDTWIQDGGEHHETETSVFDERRP